MEFRFRAGDGGLSSHLSRPRDRRFTPRAGPGHFHGGPPPPQIEWEVAARSEQIIREEVERRLIEEEVCRELALARAGLHGEFGPQPFFRHDGPFVPTPPGPFLGVDVPFMPPTPASFGPWQGSGPRRCSGFGQRKPKHKLKPHNVERNESSKVLSSEIKVFSVKSTVDAIAVTTEPTPSSEADISGVKSKVDVIAVTNEPAHSSEADISGVKRKADVISVATEPTKLQKAAKDWSCALCQVRTTGEASLNTHLEGKKHKAKLSQRGVIKGVSDFENGFQATTGNKDSGRPTDAPRKICILVDGVMHEVVQKTNHLWCERCRVRCESNMTMADHLRGKKHSALNKIWKSIEAVRLNKSKEGSSATCKKKVNENGPVEIHVEVKKQTADMVEEVNENSLTETPVEIDKKDTDITSEVNKNSHIEILMETKHEDTDMAREINEKNGHVEVLLNFRQEGTDMVMNVNTNGFTEIPAKDMKEGADVVMERNENFFSEIPIEISKETADVAADVTCDVIAVATEPTKLQKAAQNWSCALCQVRTTSEAALNTHLEGKKHKVMLARCGVIKETSDYDNGVQATTGTKDSGRPTDAPRNICILVDGVMHEVVQKTNHLWCERCRVRCKSNMAMADHLRGKKHSELNKIWKSIEAVRLNKSKEDSSATQKRKVNENVPIIIPEVGNKEGDVEIHVEMKKETADVAMERNENCLLESHRN